MPRKRKAIRARSGVLYTDEDSWDIPVESSIKEEDDGPSRPFKLDACTPEIEYDGPIPTVLLTPEAYNDMFTLIDEASDEISWLGSVVQQPSGDLLIKEIFLPEQECGAASTEMTEEGLTKLATEILSRPDGTDLWNSIRFWGHSHVRMDVFASTTDDSQMSLFKKQVKDGWFLRGIFNKLGKAKFWLYRYDKGIVINDVPWSIYSPITTDRRRMWKNLIKKKVTVHKYVYTGGLGGSGFYGYGSGYGASPVYHGSAVHGSSHSEFSTEAEDKNGGRQSEALQCVRRGPISGEAGRRGRRRSGREQVDPGTSEIGNFADQGVGL